MTASDPELPPGFSRETTISRDGRGRWFHDGLPVEHPGVARAFDSWVDVAPDGRTCLRNAIHWVYVAIEGPAFFVRSVRIEGDHVTLVLSGDVVEPLDGATLRQDRAGALYCDVRGGKLVARFDRHAAFGLASLLGEDEHGVYVRVGGRRFSVPIVADPFARRVYAEHEVD